MALNVLKSSRALCPRFSVCFSVLITSLGQEGAGLCASRTFVCLFCACMFLSFSLPLGVEGWLWFVIVPWTFLLTFLRAHNLALCSTYKLFGPREGVYQNSKHITEMKVLYPWVPIQSTLYQS